MPRRGPKKKSYKHEVATSTVKWKSRGKGAPMMLGYARVSTSDQNNQRQVDELVKFGVHPSDIFQDKQSGKTMDRLAWQALYRDLQKDDILVIYSLDRLGRKLSDLIEIEQKLYERGVRLKVICQPIDTSTAAGRMIFHMLGSVAQWEREWNLEHTLHGLKAARARGVVGGADEKYSDHQIKAAIAKRGSVAGAARELDCAAITIKRRMEKWKKKKQ
jgi:DNA invertase Pin-like site-specific DNA recombinase